MHACGDATSYTYRDAHTHACGDATSAPVLAVDPRLDLVAMPVVSVAPAPEAIFASITGDYDALYGYDGCDAADP